MPTDRLLLFAEAPCVQRGDTPLHFTRARAPWLLAYLALHPGLHPRDDLAQRFWPQAEAAQARLSLRVTLAELRKQLGEDALQGDRDHLGLRSDALWVDVRAFAQEAQAEDDAGQWQQAVRRFEPRLLQGCGDEWAEQWRARVQTLQARALLQLAAAARMQGQYPQGAQWAEQALALDPCNEAAHQQRMACLEAQGLVAQALEQYERCGQALGAQGALPSAATQGMARRLQAPGPVDAQAQGAAASSALPRPLTSFIGRERHVHALMRHLNAAADGRAAPLLTLTGPGGSGKTRLSLECVRALPAAVYPDGIWWVELAALSQEAQVAQAVATVCGVQEVAAQPMRQTLVQALRARRGLLVLDNCEHLICACTELVQELIGACAHLRILTSSREALGLPCERRYPVPALDLTAAQGAELAEVAACEAVRLFVERAQALHPSFQVQAANSADVLAICRRLDGIPLAIELAAARVNLLTPAQIARRLDQRFSLLRHPDHAVLARQQTLGALIDWSYDLLSESERALLRALSVCRGGWDVAAAAAIAALEPAEATRLLSQLADKSLLQRDPVTPQRFTTLETIREYAAANLLASFEHERVAARHFGVFLAMAERLKQLFIGPRQLASLKTLEQEHDNLVVAQNWALQHGTGPEQLRLGVSLGPYWRSYHLLEEGLPYLSKVLQNTAHEARAPAAWAQCTFLEGEFLWRRGSPVDGLQKLRSAFRMFRQLNDEYSLAECAYRISVVWTTQGHMRQGERWVKIAHALANRSGNQFIRMFALNSHGELARMRCEHARALDWYQQSRELALDMQDDRMIAFAFMNMALVLIPLERIDSARAFLFQAASRFLAFGEKPMLPYLLEGLAAADAAQGHLARAATLYAAVERQCHMTQVELYKRDQELHDTQVQALRARMERSTFDAAWQQGLQLAPETAFALVRAAEGAAVQSSIAA